MPAALCLLTALLLPPAVHGAEPRPAASSETYYYEAVPAGKPGAKELTSVTLTYKEGRLYYVSETTAPARREELRADLDAQARPGSLERTVFAPGGALLRREKIWREGARAYLETDGGAPKAYKLEPGREFSAGDTVTALLRSFPFLEDAKWELTMVDFSGRRVSVTVRNSGPEKVSVPAGEFDCYKLELTVNIPLIKPKIYCWLSKEAPHFLVKQRGKRGPFTSYYETVLTARN